ncbi:MAG: tail fiber domain-containing protein [Bacteroidia bacterium]|nr:tail fiber domain-containing protein [Bacteroidia bacterium]
MRHLWITFLLIMVLAMSASAQQGVSVTTDNTPPDASAIFDVKSTTRGVLVPRMTLVQRNAIATPATGLLIYQTNGTTGFYYYNGTAWTAISAAADNLGNHTATTNLNLGTNSITNTTNITASGTANLGGNAYPTVMGTSGQVLTTNGAGLTSWGSVAGESTTANNGLTVSGVNVALGGDLIGTTNINQDNAEVLRINNNSTVGTVIDLQNTGDFRILDAGVNALQLLDNGTLTVGTTNQFQVNNAGNITRINNLVTSFPTVQGTAGQVLTNDGAGDLSWTTIADEATTANNGLTLAGQNVTLGGDLTATTTITQDNAEVLRINNNGTAGTIIDLQNTGDLRVMDNGTNAFQVLDDGRVIIGTASQLSINNTGNITRLNNVVTNFPNAQGAAGTFLNNDGAGNLDWVAAPSFTDPTTASNGLTLMGNDVRLGGAISASTTVSQSGALALTFANNATAATTINLQNTGDFLVQNNGANALTVLDNGNVTIGTSGQMQMDNTGDFIRINNVATSFPTAQGAAGSVLSNDGAGNLSWAAPATSTDATTASNGLTLIGNDVRFGGALTANTTVAQTAALALTFTNNATAATTINLQNSGDFLVQDNGINALTVQDNGTVTFGSTGQMQIDNSGNFVRINDLPTNFPTVQGNPGTFLRNDGSGNLAWTPPAFGGWFTTGNTGTVAGTHFIGNINDEALEFRVNNQRAGYVGNSGNYNTFWGHQAGIANSTGDGNTAVGKSALLGTTTGGGNTAMGQGSMAGNVGGTHNSAYGINSLVDNNGTQNAAFGATAGNGVISGGYNAFFGAAATGSSPTRTNGGAFGINAVADSDNRIRLGSGSHTSIGGSVAYTNFSDKRFKFNIEDDVKGLDLIMKLNPVTYQFDYNALHKFYQNSNPAIQDAPQSAGNDMRQIGFMAQEIDSLCQAIGFDFGAVDRPSDTNSGIYGIRYTAFVPVLVKALQEQQLEIAALNVQNQVATAENVALRAQFSEVEIKLQELETLKTEILQIKQTLPLFQVSNH